MNTGIIGKIRMAWQESRFSHQQRIRRFTLLGVRITSISPEEAAKKCCSGGLILAPSGPGLCNVAYDANYCRALQESDINLADSILAIMIMLFLGIGRLRRTSGLGFLRALLKRNEIKQLESSYWVMPSTDSMTKNLAYLNSMGIPVHENNCYVAPMYPAYGEVRDFRLLAELKQHKPRFIMICTGSGSQEKLGAWLNRRLDYHPTICCIGAAIAFESGDQIHIPRWADALGLGWLFRCFSNPKVFVPRYFKSLELIYLSICHRRGAPLHAAQLLIKNNTLNYISYFLIIQGIAVFGSLILWHDFLEFVCHTDMLAHRHWFIGSAILLLSTIITRIVRMQGNDYISINNTQNLRSGFVDWLLTSAICLVALVMTRDLTISRTFIITYLPILLLVMVSCNLLLPTILTKYFFRKTLTTNTVIIPLAIQTKKNKTMIAKMHSNWAARNSYYCMEISGRIGEESSPGLEKIRYLGPVEEFPSICNSHGIRHAMILMPNSQKSKIEKLIQECEHLKIHLSLIHV